jgi:hypothetical protein
MQKQLKYKRSDSIGKDGITFFCGEKVKGNTIIVLAKNKQTCYDV